MPLLSCTDAHPLKPYRLPLPCQQDRHQGCHRLLGCLNSSTHLRPEGSLLHRLPASRDRRPPCPSTSRCCRHSYRPGARWGLAFPSRPPFPRAAQGPRLGRTCLPLVRPIRSITLLPCPEKTHQKTIRKMRGGKNHLQRPRSLPDHRPPCRQLRPITATRGSREMRRLVLKRGPRPSTVCAQR